MDKIKYILTVLFCFLSTVLLLGVTISGQIIGANGLPESRAKVILIGNYAEKTITDEEGKFTINASIGDYLRIETADNRVQENKIISENITISIDAKSKFLPISNELSTTFLESTGAISVITSEEIMKSSAANPYNALYGKGLGITVLQNNGSSANVLVRGINTLHNLSPLILVDGFERPLELLTTEEIESIQILKDAAATAIYGLRGSNGVILVTTKKGAYNTQKVTVSYDHAFNRAVQFPQFVNAQTYARAVNEALILDKSSSVRYNEYEINAFGSGNSPYYADVNWVNELLKNTGSSNIYNLNFQGGGKNSRYYSTIGLITNSGYVKPGNIVPQFSSQLKFSQFNARTNLDIDLTKTTELSIKVGGIIQSYNFPAYSGEGIMDLLYQTPSAAFPIKTQSGNFGASNIWGQNPVAEITSRGFNSVNNRTLLADIAISQKLDMFIPGLSVSARMGLDTYAEYLEGQTQNYLTEVNTVLFDENGSPNNVVTNLTGQNTTPSRYRYLGLQWRTYNFVGQANYERFFEKSVLKALAFVNIDQATNNGQYNTRNRMRVVANAHYGYDSKYFVDATMTLHGSNLLPPSNRFGYFPALSGAWLVSNESFLKTAETLTYLKLRASFGITGRDILPENAHDINEQLYGSRPGAYFTDGYGYYSGLGELRLASNTSTYEKSYKYNLGVDISLFNMIDITVDAFLAQTRDILVNAYGRTAGTIGLMPYPGSTSFLPFDNIGAVDNKGIELGVNFNKTFGDIAVSAGGNFTFTRNKIIEIGEGYYPNEAAKQTGNSVGQLIGYETIGIFENDADINNSLPQNIYPVVPGDLKFADLYGDGVIDYYDRKALGYSTITPEIYYSFNLGVEYKGVGFDALFQGTANYSTYLLNNGLFLPLVGNSNLSQHYYDNRWTPENLGAKYPRLSMNNNTNNFSINSTWVTDASYLKLRHCEIYYKLPEKVISPVKLQNVKLYVRGMDLLSFNSIKVIDPEMINAGKRYPSTMSINIGTRIDF